MNYIELFCNIPDSTSEATEILIAELDELGYDSFREEEYGLYAYIAEHDFDMHKVKEIYAVKEKIYGNIEFKHELFKEKNWNEYWEKNFQPVDINEILIIKAPFHNIEKTYKYEIILEPKMSFGTGHHASTWLMLSGMMDMDFNDKKVLDIGCGTGILSIFAWMLGSKEILAIDNNDWAFENAKENILLNNAGNIKIKLGEISDIGANNIYKIILANINRNVILKEMKHYIEHLNPGGEILFSGILTENFNDINDMAIGLNLILVKKEERNNWLLLRYKK